jgi:sec-independent protein translocase protein TatB
MFDVGFQELVLLFVIGLLVLGPQRLPKVAAQLGKWVGRARRTATQLRRQLEREIELAEIQAPKPPPPPTATTSGSSDSTSLSQSAREMSDALADSAAGRVPASVGAPESNHSPAQSERQGGPAADEPPDKPQEHTPPQ